MQLNELYSLSTPSGFYLHSTGDGFSFQSRPPKTAKQRRQLLARVYEEGVHTVRSYFFKEQEARSFVRLCWREEITEKAPWDLPVIIGEDGFVRFYAEGRSLTFSLFQRIWTRHLQGPFHVPHPLCPLYMGDTEHPEYYFDVKATPPGLLPKLFSSFRVKKDPELLRQVQSDLYQISSCRDLNKRRLLSVALLSFGATYRELDGQVLYIPSFCEHNAEDLIPYGFRHHLLWEGIKTISARPLERETEEPGIYLCQGTEIWPSQPSTLGSLFANLGKEGSATEPYAHSWRIIHKHLREMTREGGPLPIVAGHSMGGALATQIALYSHPLLSKAYAFNPPVVEERDFRIFHRLSREAQHKLLVYANVDDLPFWRIGSKVIGQVTLFLTAERWKYRPIRNWEMIFVLPALIKALINLVDAFPSHQSIYPLMENYMEMPLSSEEIEKENLERVLRHDHLYFYKLHSPARMLLSFVRSHFKWEKSLEYLQSQLEILTLHEQDLQETLAMEGGEEAVKVLEEVSRQKEALLYQLQKQFKN